jgi:hypothetical protein
MDEPTDVSPRGPGSSAGEPADPAGRADPPATERIGSSPPGTAGSARPAAAGPASAGDELVVEELEAEIEVVDGLPVVSSRRELSRSAAALPAVQTAAAAATGFMVGAATLALLRRRDSRRLMRELRDLRGRVDPVRRPPEAPMMEPGQSYLVHVRVFSRPPHDPRG